MQIENLCRAYLDLFPQSTPFLFSLAPGRVNLLGEHTDYNDGFVLPLAVDAHVALVGGRNKDRLVRLYSLDACLGDVFSLDQITLTKDKTWNNCIRGICTVLLEAGYPLEGMNIVLQSNLPAKTGLSYSAALEVAAALFMDELHQFQLDALDLIRLARKAENKFIGMKGGIMDQFVSMFGKKDHALFLDCRFLVFESIAAQFEKLGFVLLVINSGKKSTLGPAGHNLRRAQCEAAVRSLRKHLAGISALRDVTVEHLNLINALPRELAMRARHVVTENQRVLDGARALKQKDLKTLGGLLTTSHRSLRDDYKVSSFELDLLVDLTSSFSGTLGSRMTGVGFGASIISLVALEQLQELKAKVGREYAQQTGIRPKFYTFKASAGAKVLHLKP
ncbi:MAG: galactokinase [Firmicutes bacterium]|nr:galactokinase [Bacillota bacterium]